MATKSKTIAASTTTTTTEDIIMTTTKAPRKVASGTMEQLAKKLPVKGNSFFDPMDVIMDTLRDVPRLSGRLAESMAWMLDTATNNISKNILFERFKDSNDECLQFNEFKLTVGDNLCHASLYEEDSAERTLAILLAISPKWHRTAGALVTSDDRDYKGKTCHDLMMAETAKEVTTGECNNFRRMAKRESKGDLVKEERLFKAMVDQANFDKIEKVANNKKLITVIDEIQTVAGHFADETFGFHDLPLNTQRMLTEFCLNTVNRELTQLCSYLSKKPLEFERIDMAAEATIEQLENMLSTRLSDVGELEYAGMPASVDNFNREQKRVAIEKV